MLLGLLAVDDVADTAFEVMKVAADLFKREPQREDAFDRIYGQNQRETLTPDRREGIDAVVERGFGWTERAWSAPGGERVSALAEIVGGGFRDARERRSEPLPD